MSTHKTITFSTKPSEIQPTLQHFHKLSINNHQPPSTTSHQTPSKTSHQTPSIINRPTLLSTINRHLILSSLMLHHQTKGYWSAIAINISPKTTKTTNQAKTMVIGISKKWWLRPIQTQIWGPTKAANYSNKESFLRWLKSNKK